MRRVLKAVGGDLARVFPPPMDEYRIGRSDRLAPRSREPLRVFCDGLAHMISMPPEFEIYLSGRLGRFAEPENTETPSIIAGRDLPGIPFEEQRFEIGRALAYLRDFHMVAARLSPEDLSLLYHAAMNAADPSAPLPDADSAAIRETARRLSRAMPRKAKKALEDLVVEFSVTPRPDFASWKKGCELTACRTGLLLCGDLKAAMRCVWRRAHRDGEPPMGATLAELRDNLERSDAARDLLGYAVSEEYFNAREFLSQE
jgi:hypothetical protein